MDILWQASGNGGAQVIGFLTIPILTRLYTPDDFATLGLFLQIVVLLSVIMTLRYEHFINLPKNDYRADLILKLIIAMCVFWFVIGTSLMYFFRDSVAYAIGKIEISEYLIFAPLAASILSLSVAVQYKVQRHRDFKNSGLSEVCNKVGYLVFGVSGVFFFKGATGLILSPAIGALSKVAWLTFSLLKTNNLKRQKTKIPTLYELKEVAVNYLKLSGSLTFSHIMLVFTGGIPIFFTNKMYGSETLGQFSLVVSTLYLPSSLIGNAIGQVYYQRAAKCRSDNQHFNNLWKSTAKRLLVIGIPFYTTLSIISTWVYPFVFGAQWSSAGEYAAFLSISAFFSFFTSPLDRGSLVVKAWRYIPFWHTARALTTGFIAWLAWIYQWEFDVFLMYLIFQMCIMYLVDYFAQWRFSFCKE